MRYAAKFARSKASPGIPLVTRDIGMACVQCCLRHAQLRHDNTARRVCALHLHDPVEVVHGAPQLLAVLAVEGAPMGHGPQHPAQLDAVGPPESTPHNIAGRLSRGLHSPAGASRSCQPITALSWTAQSADHARGGSEGANCRQEHKTRRQDGLLRHLMARRPKRMPSSGPRLIVVRARRRAGAWQVRALTRRWLPLPALAVYTAACTAAHHVDQMSHPHVRTRQDG